MIFCEYGCGKEGIYKFKNGKWCCSNNISGCKKINEKQQNGNIGKVFSKQRKINISNSLMGRTLSEETKKKLSKVRKGRTLSEETKKKISLANKGKKRSKEFKKNVGKQKRITIKQIKKKYSFFSQIEEMRYNPVKLGEKEIQVHCKNYLCKNSKENGGWFTPTGNQLDGRRRALEDKNGNDGHYFYCSDECKNVCPLFNFNPHRELQKEQIKEVMYTDEEYQIFRQEVLKRQLQEHDYNFCEYCDSREMLHVHHEKPQKTNPLFVLDPDNGVVFCKDCHYIIGHKDECSTENLAKRICL